jgi:hypothetical protein
MKITIRKKYGSIFFFFLLTVRETETETEREMRRKEKKSKIFREGQKIKVAES